MKVTYNQLEKEIEELNKALNGSYLDRIISLNNHDFSFFFSRNKAKILFLSLNNDFPFWTMITKDQISGSNLLTPFLQVMRKEILRGQLVSISLLNEDRLVAFTFRVMTQTYQMVERKLIFELFSCHPNLCLLDEQNIILGVYKPSKTLDVTRPLIKNLTYQFPEKNFLSLGKGPSLSFTDFFSHYQKKLDKINARDQYRDVLTLIPKKIHNLLRKKELLEQDINKAGAHDLDMVKGNLLLTYLSEIPSQCSQITLENTIISLDIRLSPLENANHYFKSYRKSKTTIKMLTEQQKLLENDLTYFYLLESQVKEASLSELDQIKEELQSQGYLKIISVKKTKKIVKTYLPSYITYRGEKIAFGKNNFQNDYLTFALAQSNYHFFHIKNLPGAHVVIMAKNPNDELIKCAAEIALLLSKQTMGEVHHALVKDVKKAGKPGLVTMTKYHDIYLKEIRTKTIELLKTATKI